MNALTGSVRWRLYFVYSLLLVGILGTAGILAYSQVQGRLIDSRLSQTRELVTWALTRAEPPGSLRVNDINQIIDSLLTTPTPDYSFYLLDASGELVLPLGQGRPIFIEVPVSLAGLSPGDTDKVTTFVGRAAGDRYRTLTSIWPVFDADGFLIGAVQAEVRLDEADMALSRLAGVLAVGFLLLYLAAGGLWLLLTGSVLRPLEEVARVSRAVDAGELDHRIPLPRVRDEAYYTAVAFNEMLDSLQAHMSRETEAKLKTQQFLADASHELRTPLTVLRGYVDVLRRGAKEDPRALRTALDAMHVTVDKMTRLSNDLLSLSQLDLGTELHIEVVELNALCRSTVEMAKVIAEGRHMEFRPGPASNVDGDARLLERVLWNLLDNAVRHTAPDGKVIVGVASDGRRGYLTVQDDGEGIHPEHLPRIFDRFYRVDPARPGGAGLGLSIVKAIVEMHQGEVAVRSTPGRGTTFTIVLPLAA